MNSGKIGVIIGCFLIGCMMALVFIFTGRSVADIYDLQVKKAKFVPYQKMHAHTLCKDENFTCMIIQKNITWEKFWPDARERGLIMKLNRNNIILKSGMPVVIPKDLKKSLMDFSPYPRKIPATGEKFVIFDPALLAWGAYDKDGNLVRWGPALGGADWCYDTHRKCRTVTGENFRIEVKGNQNSRSGAYPVGCGSARKPCARMPWVMYFYLRRYGLHGSDTMVGWNASHGCVRMFTDDAEWMNKQFVEIGTKVIVRPYPYPNSNR